MSVDNLLTRLEKVRKTGATSWLACCPAHDDRSPSLSIRETDDGRILLHCFAGCDVWQIVMAIGLEMDALYPPKTVGVHLGKHERRPFPAMDVLRAVSFEAMVIVAAGTTFMAGHSFSQVDRDRLMLAVERIQAAVDAAMPTIQGKNYD